MGGRTDRYKCGPADGQADGHLRARTLFCLIFSKTNNIDPDGTTCTQK